MCLLCKFSGLIGKIPVISGIALCLMQVSCFTVKYSTSGASIPVEAKTVSVQFFENQSQNVEPSLGIKITNDLKDYIQSNSKLILVNGTGDLDFDGEITYFDTEPTGITAGEQLVSQNRFKISINVRYTNSFDAEKDWESSFSRFYEYPASESFQVAKQNYTDEIVKLIIEDVFNKAFVNW